MLKKTYQFLSETNNTGDLDSKATKQKAYFYNLQLFTIIEPKPEKNISPTFRKVILIWPFDITLFSLAWVEQGGRDKKFNWVSPEHTGTLLLLVEAVFT